MGIALTGDGEEKDGDVLTVFSSSSLAPGGNATAYAKMVAVEAARIYKQDHMVSLLLSKPLMPGNIVGLEVAKARNSASSLPSSMKVSSYNNVKTNKSNSAQYSEVLVSRPSALQLGVFMDVLEQLSCLDTQRRLLLCTQADSRFRQGLLGAIKLLTDTLPNVECHQVNAAPKGVTSAYNSYMERRCIRDIAQCVSFAY